MLTNVLKKLGLSEKEANVYLTCLRIGTTRTSIIAKRSGLSRSTTYNMLHELKKQGFVKLIHKAKVQHFTPIEPAKIVELLERRKTGMEINIENIKHYMPQLESIKNPNITVPKVSFYEGVEGIKYVYEDILKHKDIKTYVALSLDNIMPAIKKWLIKVFTPRKIKNNISSEILLSSKKAKEYKKLDSKHMRETSIIPFSKHPFEIEIDVYADNKTAFISFDESEMFAVLIESPKIARSMKSLFALTKR